MSIKYIHSFIQGAHAGLKGVIMAYIFVFTFIRLLERSYFCLFLWKGLIKVLF